MGGCSAVIPKSLLEAKEDLLRASASMMSDLPPRNCALVATTDGLRGRGLGAAIDSHDLVVRLGTAPTMGLEADVGRRTSSRYVSSACLRGGRLSGVRALLELEPQTQFVWLVGHGDERAVKDITHAVDTGMGSGDTGMGGPGPIIIPLGVSLISSTTMPNATSNTTHSPPPPPPSQHTETFRRLSLLQEVTGAHQLPRPSLGLVAVHHLLTRGRCAQVSVFGIESDGVGKVAGKPASTPFLGPACSGLDATPDTSALQLRSVLTLGARPNASAPWVAHRAEFVEGIVVAPDDVQFVETSEEEWREERHRRRRRARRGRNGWRHWKR